MVHWHFYVYFGKKNFMNNDRFVRFYPSVDFCVLTTTISMCLSFKNILLRISKVKAIFPFYFQLFWNVWLLTRCPKQHRTHVPQCPRMKIWPTPPLNISKKNLKRNMKKHRKNKQRRKKNSLTFLLLKKKKNFSSSYSHQFFSLFKKKFQEDSTSFHNLIYKKFF